MLSVIVPAHRAAHLLPDTLGALRASAPVEVVWELLVVDDGSADATAAVAEAFADRVIRLPAPPQGPGHARNVGAEAARGRWLLFVDADVRVHADTLQQVWRVITAHPDVASHFGSYDDAPAAPGLVSRYRNLLHRYVHLRDAGPAETFWAGLGAVRADAFRAVAGFDTLRFPRPQIEDIDLGYRLRDHGYQLRLDPSIQGTHLKHWTFRSMARTDFVDRALPWMRLLLARRRQGTGITAILNIGHGERLRVMAAGIAMVLVAAGLLWAPVLVSRGGVLLGLIVLSKAPLLRWLAHVGGPMLALGAIPLQLWYYCSNAVAAVVGLLHQSRPATPATARRA
jgi:glycosyltransferase involved in cell wall biosynthesis